MPITRLKRRTSANHQSKKGFTQREHVMHSLSIINKKYKCWRKEATKEWMREKRLMSQAIFITLTARTDKNYYCYLFHISYAARFLWLREREREFAIFLVVVSFVLPFIHSSSSRSTKRIYASQAVSARQRAKWKNNKNIEFDAGKSKHTTTTLCTSSRLFAKKYIWNYLILK